MNLASYEEKAIIRERINAGAYESKDPPKSALARFDEQKRLLEHFKSDVFVAYGLSTYAHREKLFDFAWDLGHASGLYDVLNYMDDVVRLALVITGR